MPENRLDTSQWLEDSEFRRLFITLCEIGDTRFVGGAVRDALLGKPHSDIDLATTALPEAVVQAAEAAGFQIVLTGIAHGTVTAILQRGPVEITTLRRDVATDGRHATVSYTDDWHEDAARRDFTINALSCAMDGTVYDYFGGIDDLNAGRVRFIGVASQRITEDYLRILRFFRFAASYETGAPDPQALEVIARLSPNMTMLSGERIQAEVLKLLASPRAGAMWRLMMDAGVIGAVLGGATDVVRLERVIEIEQQHGLNDPFRRLIAVMTLPSIPEIENRLKLSNAQRQRILSIHDDERVALLRAGHFDRALYGADTESILDLAILDSTSDDEIELYGLLTFLKTWKEPKFPLGGDALMDIGLKPGPIFGDLLRHVEQWWIDSDFQPTKQECFAELKRVWAQRKS